MSESNSSNVELSTPIGTAGTQPALSEGVAIHWHRFSKVTMLNGVFRLFGALIALVVVGTKQILESATVSSLWELALSLGLMAVWWILAGIAVLSVIATVIAAISWRFRTFALAADGIHMRSGVFIKKHTHMRWDRVQSVDVTQGIMARVFRQGTVAVDSAGGGEKVSLGLLPLAQCRALRHAIMDTSATMRAGGRFNAIDERWMAEQGSASESEADTDEVQIYELSVKRMIVTSVFSGSAIVGLLSLVIGVIVAVFATSGAVAIPLFLVVAGALWNAIKNLAKKWNTRVFLAQNGVRLRSGLVSTFAQTIPPGRVHAVEIYQPVLWRRMGLWSVKVLIASDDLTDVADTKQNSSLLMPAGTRGEAEQMLWVLLPDLGVEDPHAFLRESFEGAGGSAAYLPAPRASRFFDPWGWKRNAISLTRTVAVLRWGGFWRRSVRVIWHDHYQSLELHQGPMQRRLGLASVQFHMVSPAIGTVQKHLVLADAQRTLWAESTAGKKRRGEAEEESIHAWRARVMPRDGGADASVIAPMNGVAPMNGGAIATSSTAEE